MQEREQTLEVLKELKAYLQRSEWADFPIVEVDVADGKSDADRLDVERSVILLNSVVESATDAEPVADAVSDLVVGRGLGAFGQENDQMNILDRTHESDNENSCQNDWLQDIDRCDDTEEGTVKKWRILEDEVKACVKCRLCETRNNVVFGVGKVKSPGVVFIGEAPGAEEDMRGEPFVGRAGELLTKAISNGMGLQREDVYICNIVKCRPPENRKPQADEVASCLPYLEAQLRLLKPHVVVTLGSVATKTLFPDDKRGITELRGNWLQWKSSKVLPTFHPAYILRNPPAKKPFWEDLQLVMKEIGLSVVERKKV